MPTTVVHCKRKKFDVYIGRPSKWGNPFSIGHDGTRPEVIQKYREWVVSQPELMASLGELRGRILGCWCKPKECHGDVLAELADGRRKEDEEGKGQGDKAPGEDHARAPEEDDLLHC